MEMTQQTSPISMEPRSPVKIHKSPTETEATADVATAKDLSSLRVFTKETTIETSKLVGQLEEVVNAKVNSKAATASEGPVILEVSSS